VKPHVSIIVARSLNGVIGSQGNLPWKLPEDLRFFKQVTMGKPVIMGRRTWESIGRPLPGRRNIVITRNAEYFAPGAEIAPSFDAALSLFSSNDTVMIIGGGEVYRLAIPKADTAWVTQIEEEFEGDAYFPELDSSEWACVWEEKHPVDEKNKIPFVFRRFDRIRNLSY